MSEIRVLVVEDNPDLNADLVFFLRAHGMQTEGVASAAGMWRQMERQDWDVVLLDLGLPDGDGQVLLRQLARNPSLAVVVLTARDSLDERLAGWRGGAHVYLVKPTPLAEIAAVVSAVHQRVSPARPGDDEPTWRWYPQTRELHSPEGEAIALTHREALLIAAMAEHPGHSLSRCAGVLGDSDASLQSVVHRLRRKLKAHGDPIHTVYGVGYVFRARLIAV